MGSREVARARPARRADREACRHSGTRHTKLDIDNWTLPLQYKIMFLLTQSISIVNTFITIKIKSSSTTTT